MLKTEDYILTRMGDELSAGLYKKRLAYNNGDLEAIEKIMLTVRGGGQLIHFMNNNCRNLYIFGAGILGNEFFRTWRWKYPFRGFIDNDEKKWGKAIEGIPIMGLKDIVSGNRRDIAVVIVNKFSHGEIECQLRREGLCDRQIYNFAQYYIQLNRDQYFDLDALNKRQSERFVDCGALDGKTAMYMYEWYRGNVDRIWLFEPDQYSVKKYKENLEKLNFHRYEIIEKAVYSSAAQLLFDSTGNGMVSINPHGDTVVNAISLDEAIGDEGPSFIKMDIEGAELDALKGAKGIIRRCNPKMAVCIYHKPEDIETIPELLLEYNSDYKFYIRHYSLTFNETVLYAL